LDLKDLKDPLPQPESLDLKDPPGLEESLDLMVLMEITE